MISAKYKADLLSVREGNPGWGSSAARNAGCEVVRFLNRRRDIQTVLDFGAGNATLGEFIKLQMRAGFLRRDIRWTNYDPGMPEISKLPTEQFDCILTTDLLEHIEPDMLDETLAWIAAHADRSQFHFIDCNDSEHLLPDGRSVHLIVESPSWWYDKLTQTGWTVMKYAAIQQLRRQRQRYQCLLILDRS